MAGSAPAAVASAVAPGSAAPLGASVRADGVNFSVFSNRATLIELLLFDESGAAMPSRCIPLSANEHRTHQYWHGFVPDLRPGQVYGYRAHGPLAPERGLRFDGEKLLLDPYGLVVAVPDSYDRDAASRPGPNTASAMKSVVADPGTYDWEGDDPLGRPAAETVIYELHVRGFTKHPSSGLSAAKRGTYAGLIEKIPYLVDLGITAVELMPVFQFDAAAAPPGRPNYWGYQPVSFFAPHQAYASRHGRVDVLDEFRDMVKALHRAGIEVILDVVYNHTAEGGFDGPTFCQRGLANDVYYILEKNRSRYADYTGCGNTLNANQSIVRRLIQDSLRYWVSVMHVDGFRFDLASVMSRDEAGHPLATPPVVWDIESDPQLAGTKVIAEPWDAAGFYQVGSFAGDRWLEWNGRFRDDVRRFVKGDRASVPGLATRLLGSPDIYGHEEREPEQSINFVTCHDGFTLNDLVSYNEKHNEANGENNRDGANDNQSWNCGVEGPTDDAAVEALRIRQVKNFFVLTLLAPGMPLLLMGDEVRRSQGGNNNAYCQDSELSWFDWTLLERHADVRRLVKALNAFRQRRDVVVEGTPVTLNELLRRGAVEWHGTTLNRPDWGDDSHSLAFTWRTVRGRFLMHGMLNAYWEPLTFEVPAVPDTATHGWRRFIDTAVVSPDDTVSLESAPSVTAPTCVVEPRSIVLLGLTLPKTERSHGN
jgi:isoamylase